MPSEMLVIIPPGATALIRIGLRAYSIAMALVMFIRPGLAGAIGGGIGLADEGGGRAAIDDRAVVLKQMRNGGLAEKPRRVEIDRDGLEIMLARHLGGVRHADDPGDVAQRIEPAKPRDRRRHRAGAGIGIGKIGDMRQHCGIAQHWAAVSARRSALTSTMHRSAPASASFIAVARPRPEAAPVTSAALPFMSMGCAMFTRSTAGRLRPS